MTLMSFLVFVPASQLEMLWKENYTFPVFLLFHTIYFSTTYLFVFNNAS